MHRILEPCAAVLGRVIFIGFGIQIVLGALWMCNAFANLNGFGEGIVCVCQLLLFACALFFFFREVFDGSLMETVFGCLSVLMFPMVLQCHMTKGTQSAAVSLLLFETAFVWRILKRPSGKFCAAAAFVFWMFLGVLMPEYFLIGAVPMIFLLFCCVLRPKMRDRALICITAAAVVTGAAVGSVAVGREHNSLKECLAHRFAWSSLMDAYQHLPGQWQEKVSMIQVRSSSYEAIGMEEILFPYLKSTLDPEEREGFLGELTAVSWERNSRQIMKEIIWDMAGYTVSPAVLQLQLVKRAYSSYSGVNYRQLLLPAPKLGKLYMDYGCWWFLTALATSVVLRSVKWLQGNRIPNKPGGLMVSATCFFMAVFYTMISAGRMDYRKTAFILCIWLFGIIGSVVPQETGEIG